MSRIIDYIKWRGDITFDTFPINQVDIAALTQLSLLDFTNVISGDEQITLKEAFERYDATGNDSEIRGYMLTFVRIYDVFKEMSISPRYMNLLLSDYIEIFDYENPTQFEAITIHVGKELLICYGGTDESIVGWHEDFKLLYLAEIPCHILGREYLKKIAEKYDSNLILCGHSKGANIAMHTMLDASDEIAERINKVYCYDGPGINKRDYDIGVLNQRLDRIESYIPYKSSIGKLFEHYEKYHIVECSANLVFQHDLLTWHVMRSDFIYREKESQDSVYLDGHVKKVLYELSDDEAEKLVSAIFHVIYSSGIKNTGQLLITKAKLTSNVMKLSKEEKKMFNKVIYDGMLKDPRIRKMLLSIFVEKKKID